jgi:hypothetical protein
MKNYEKKYFAKIRRDGSAWVAEIWVDINDDGINIVNQLHSRAFMTRFFADRWARRDLRKHWINDSGFYEILAKDTV